MNFRRWAEARGVAACLAAGVLCACGSTEPASAPAASAPAQAADASGQTPPPPSALPPPDAPDEALPATPDPLDALPDDARARILDTFTGDLDEMVKRRAIRAGVAYNRTHYFIDRGEQRGVAYESLMNFEEALNAHLKTGNLKVHVAIIPMSRDQLLPALVNGKVDVVVAGLTVTPQREQVVDFSEPTRNDINEIAVTAPGEPPVATAEDLAGRQVFVRRSSSYYESLTALNVRLKAAGRPPVDLKEAPEQLEDDDILEMVNAGLARTTVVDDYMAEFWKQVLPDITLHPAAAVRTGGRLGVAVRKGNPRMKNAVNVWLEKYPERSSFRNVIEKRYLQSTRFVNSAASAAERKKFEDIVSLFRKYGGQYDLDPILMAAQGYQESRLDQGAKSHVGAVGVMQVMPATGKELNVGDIHQLEPNIHAGVKYIRFMIDQYYKDEPMTPLNKTLMAFASYNAGPGRVRQLRREAAKRGLDPNVWLGNVEHIASEKIGRETVQYVSNIYKYYVAYTLALEERSTRETLKSGSR